MFVAANKWTLPIPGSISIRPVDQRANQLGRTSNTARGNYSERLGYGSLLDCVNWKGYEG